ncbi:hypothetical protein ACFLUJ_06905 [Chloroflexota bacterium]
MELLYELTILSSLALMAIVVAIFILASSLHGNAVKMAAEEEETLLAKRRDKLKELSKQLGDKISEQLSDATAVSGKTVEKWSKDLSKIGKGISKARSKGKVLTVNNIVTVPFGLLLGAVIGSAFAIVTKGIIPNITWGLSLLLIGFSLFWIYRNLRFVEDFSTSVGSSILIPQSSERVSSQVPEQKSLVVDKSEESPADEMQEIIRANLAAIPPREAHMLAFRYGMGERRLSTERIGQEWNVSPREAGVILVRGLRMNRHPSRSGKLKKFVDDLPASGQRDGWQEFVGDIFGV